MNAAYWTVKDGQLLPGEALDSGYRHKDAADVSAAQVAPQYQAVVKRFQTIESDYPIEDARYEPFSSARWCVVVVEVSA